MSGNKICPLGTNEKHMMICPKGTCALYDDARKCCGLIQVSMAQEELDEKCRENLHKLRMERMYGGADE